MKATCGLCVTFLAMELAMAAGPGAAPAPSEWEPLVKAEQRLAEQLFEQLSQGVGTSNLVFAYFERNGLQVVELPFRDSRFVCRLALSEDDSTKTASTRREPARGLIEAFRQTIRLRRDELSPQLVEVSVPEWRGATQRTSPR